MRYPLWTICAVCINLALLFSSCTETLPPRLDPSNLFQTRIEGSYHIGGDYNGLRVYLTLTNTFDETLQDTATLRGALQIKWAGDQTYQKTASLSASNVIVAKNFDRSKNLLTVDPQDFIILEYVWNFVDDSGRRIPFNLHKDTTCIPSITRMYADSQIFILTSQFTVFSRAGVSDAGPRLFRMCYYDTVGALPPDCERVKSCDQNY